MSNPEAASRDEEFDAYVAARSRRWVRVATMLVGRHDAEDAVQDALISLYRRWDRVVAADNPDAYLHRSLVNASLQLLRRRRRIELPQGFDVAGPDEAVSERQAMLQSLGSLPPRQRAVLVLSFYEDLDEAEIAAAMIAPAEPSRARKPAPSRLCVSAPSPRTPTSKGR